jgi:hypothetical protein
VEAPAGCYVVVVSSLDEQLINDALLLGLQVIYLSRHRGHFSRCNNEALAGTEPLGDGREHEPCRDNGKRMASPPLGSGASHRALGPV